MKTLSIRQPWAELILAGFKQIETRSWPTNHRGPLLIHASGRPRGTLPVGCIVGIVDVARVARVGDLRVPEAERMVGDYRRGNFGWMLKNPARLRKPIWIRGALGLWEYKGDIHDSMFL